MIVYRVCQAIARAGWPLIGGMDIRGDENVPREGPFLLISNHQSVLDPILIQAFCPRPLHTMAKSTQFASPAMRWLMTRLNSFPVRRFEIDPQAVRTALRRLEEGHGVGIYIEGERSWDGELQPPRLGTVRLVLRAGVPVVPAAIAGSYEAWPRWASGLRRADVAIRFGQPLRWPAMRRKEREANLEHAATRIMAVLADLLADARQALIARDSRREASLRAAID
ncbi:MAG TPA: lysophospholipid acyltransferase family protein [Longimicrobiales bacterium]